jgi:MFS transporter, MHS family, proline/betaine transporter
MKPSIRKTVFLCALGIFLEGYDFAIFGALLPILSLLFFPASDPVTTMLNGFAVFATGFIIRPFAGAVFGALGDRLGRKPAILLSMNLIVVPTVAIGCLPTYSTIGRYAAVLLILCRSLQGFAFSGEYAGTMTYLSEYAAPGKRHFYLSWGSQASVLGVLFGSLLGASVATLFSEAVLMAYGWRLPFLLGALLGVCSLIMRFRLSESPVFQALQSKGQTARHPLKTLAQNHKKRVFFMVGLCFINSVAFYSLFIYLPIVWVKSGLLTTSSALWINAAQLGLFALALSVFGKLADRWGGYQFLITGILGFAILTYPLLILIYSGHLGLSLLAQTVFCLCNALLLVTMPVMYTQLFPSRTRASGVTISYNIAASVQGGTTPLVMTWLATRTFPILYQSLYIMLAATVSLACAIIIQRGIHRERT